MCPCLFMLQGFVSAKQMYLLLPRELLETPRVPLLGDSGRLVRATLAAPVEVQDLHISLSRGGDLEVSSMAGKLLGSVGPLGQQEGLRTQGPEDAAGAQTWVKLAAAISFPPQRVYLLDNIL